MAKSPVNAVPGKQGFQKTGRTERGKTAPTSAPAVATGDVESAPGNGTRLDQVTQRRLTSEDVPSWVPATSYSGFRMASYPHLHVSDDVAYGVNHESASGDVALRGVEVGRTEIAPGRFTAVYGFPGMAVDGDKPAMLMRRDSFTASYDRGVIGEDGEFHADPRRFSRAVDRWLDTADCPLSQQGLGELDDYMIRTVTADSGDRGVTALHVSTFYAGPDTEG